MPSLEQPRGKAIKKGGKEFEAAMMSGAVLAKPEELAKDESPEVRALKQQVKDLEVQIGAAEDELKEDLEKELDEVQEKLAREVSSEYRKTIPMTAEQQKTKIDEIEKMTVAIKKKRGEKTEALKKRLLPKIGKDMEEIVAEQEEEAAAKPKKAKALKEKLLPKTGKDMGEIVTEQAEQESALADLKKIEEERVAEDKEKLAKVRGKIAEKPAEEVFLSNWPKKEEAKPEEKPFTETEESWFEQGEKANENRKKVKELEKDARVSRRHGKETMAKIAEEDLAAAKAETPEGAEEASKAVGATVAGKEPEYPKYEEPHAVKEARKNFEDSDKNFMELRKKLDDMGIDADSITGGWINRMQIKIQAKVGFFGEKSKELDKLYNTYVKERKEHAELKAEFDELTRPLAGPIGQSVRRMAKKK